MIKKCEEVYGWKPYRDLGRCGHIIICAVPMFGFRSGAEGFPHLVPDESRDDNGMCVREW